MRRYDDVGVITDFLEPQLLAAVNISECKLCGRIIGGGHAPMCKKNKGSTMRLVHSSFGPGLTNLEWMQRTQDESKEMGIAVEIVDDGNHRVALARV